jgi:short subunit fatty acids transporter
MFAKRFCGVFALVVAWLAGYACVAALLLSNSEVQTLLSQVFRPEIPFSSAVLAFNALAECGLLAAVVLLAVAQLIPDETIPQPRLAHPNNRVEQDYEVAA